MVQKQYLTHHHHVYYKCNACREQILSRAQELTETKVVLELYPMIHQDQTFNMDFWSAVLQQTEGDLWEYEGSQVPYRLRVGQCVSFWCHCLP